MHRAILAFFAPLFLAAMSAFAHFPFVVLDPSGATARLLMSETLVPDTQVSIDTLAGASLFIRGADGRETPLTLTKADNWMTMAVPGKGNRVIRGVADLGVMQRGAGRPHVLVYYPKTLVGDAFDAGMLLGDRVPVELVPVRDQAGFKLKFMIAGKVAPAQEVRVIAPDGSEEDYTTDAGGLIGPFTEPGRYGAWARNWIDETGTRADKTYDQVRQYATLVFDFGAVAPEAPAAAAAGALPVRSFATLPYHVASFGAVASDGYLYLYGGHIAERHDYSTASVTNRFQRISLANPARWEELPAGNVAIQGMNLVAHKGRIIRVGGMEPRNPPGEKSDSYSITDSTFFDPAKSTWNPLPPLPQPRSSHDLAVIGDTLFVIGGWWMKGRDAEPEFLETMLSLDLSAAKPEWKSVPQPFSRRALIVATLNDQILILGGFDADDEAHLDVDIYNVRTGAWTKGPPIPGKQRNGFAPAACTIDGAVYLSVGAGDLYKLNADQTAWLPLTRTTPRLAHRMVPFGQEVIIVGGAAEADMVNIIEAVKITP